RFMCVAAFSASSICRKVGEMVISSADIDRRSPMSAASFLGSAVTISTTSFQAAAGVWAEAAGLQQTLKISAHHTCRTRRSMTLQTRKRALLNANLCALVSSCRHDRENHLPLPGDRKAG